LHAYRREFVSLQNLAEEACRIELDVLKKGIGKQDQYMAAFGGLTVLEIDQQGHVNLRNVTLRESAVSTLINHTHMYYTGMVRDTLEMLKHQNGAMNSTDGHRDRVENALLDIKDLGYRILEAIERENFDMWGLALHEHWELKKQMSREVTHPMIDALYDEVRARFDVLGGKIVGAGGGGFLMLYVPGAGRDLENFMQQHGMPRLYYYVEREGSKVVANVSSTQSMLLHPRSVTL
jgi:D-glycero-alpha-D-manno-heptose-7-phosphate kinase